MDETLDSLPGEGEAEELHQYDLQHTRTRNENGRGQSGTEKNCRNPGIDECVNERLDRGIIAMDCKICGTDLGKDLFSAVTGEKCCSICKIKFIGGLPTTDGRISDARLNLGLKDGEFLKQDNGAEAARILGRG